MTRLHRLVLIGSAAILLALTALVPHVHLQTVNDAQALGLPSGWNLIADPNGIVTTGPALTFQVGDTDYESVPPGTPLVAGLGYWVQAQGRSALPLGAGMTSATLLVEPGQFIMVGDPSGVLPALVTGADVLLVYDPVHGYQYDAADVLMPGQGAWALSNSGNPITLTAGGTSSATCSLAETGSACPVNGACPQGYPVAVSSDAVAHPQPGPGDPAVQATPVLCFNSLTQALSAGYQLAPATRLELDGPVSATVSGITFTVQRALLESPDAFMARVLASGDQLCSGCNVAGASAIVTVDYGVENINRPATLIDYSAGTFVSQRPPVESSPSYFLLQSQQAIDPVHNGVPAGGSISGVFTRSPFATIDEIDWRLDAPLIDASSSTSILQPHGPSVLFALNFRGPNSGQIVAYGGGSTPLLPYNPAGSVPPALVSATPAAPAVAGAAGVAAPTVPPAAAPATATPGSGAVNPAAPFVP